MQKIDKLKKSCPNEMKISGCNVHPLKLINTYTMQEIRGNNISKTPEMKINGIIVASQLEQQYKIQKKLITERCLTKVTLKL